MFGTLASGAKALGLRFSLIALYPFTLLIVYFFGLYAVGTASPHEGVIGSLDAAAKRLGFTGVVLLLIAAITLALVSQPFQIGVVRLLEGYWGNSSVGIRAATFAIERHRRRLYLLGLQHETFEDAQQFLAADHVAARFGRYPEPDPESGVGIMPTLLGNTLRAAEESAGGRYDLDTYTSWPRLYYCLPDAVHRDVADLHQQIDGGARLCLVLGLAGLTGVPVLLPFGWWLVVPVALLFLAVVAYRGAISAADMLRPVLESAYDLYRFDLLATQHIRLPENPEEERATNRYLSDFWAGDTKAPIPSTMTYAHAKGRWWRWPQRRQGETSR